MRVTVDGKLAARRHRQGHHPRHHRRDRHRRRHRLRIEYAGEAIRALSMEGRMTVCNMSIEGGARAGLVAPDEKTFAYLKGRPKAPKGAPGTRRCATGRRCTPTTARISTARSGSTPRSCRRSSPGAPARRTWCRSPASCPNPDDIADENKRHSKKRALDYMGLTPGTKITDIALDRVFIGSCTNGRIEDLRAVAQDRRRQDGAMRASTP